MDWWIAVQAACGVVVQFALFWFYSEVDGFGFWILNHRHGILTGEMVPCDAKSAFSLEIEIDYVHLDFGHRIRKQPESPSGILAI